VEEAGAGGGFVAEGGDEIAAVLFGVEVEEIVIDFDAVADELDGVGVAEPVVVDVERAAAFGGRGRRRVWEWRWRRGGCCDRLVYRVGADAGVEEVLDVEVVEMEVVVGHAEDGAVEGRAGEGELGDGDVSGVVLAAEEVTGAVEFFVIGFGVGEGGVVGAP